MGTGVIAAGFQPIQFDKFGGLVKCWDADKLNSDLASEAVNVKLDPGGVCTREGLVKAFQSPAGRSGLAGAVRGLFGYVNDIDGTQYPMMFDETGKLYVESPAGSGNLQGIPRAADQAAPPVGSRMIAADAFTRAFLAFGDLKQGSAVPTVYDGAKLRPIQVAAPTNPAVAAPASAATLSEVAGGNQGSRTVNVVYTYTGSLSQAPLTPVVTFANVGTDTAYDAYICITYVYVDGTESPASNIAYVRINNNQTISVSSPAGGINITGYNVYAGTANNALTLQNHTGVMLIGSTYVGTGFLESTYQGAPPTVAAGSFPETTQSPNKSEAVSANFLTQMAAPAGAPSWVRGYNVYARISGTYTLQTPNPIPIYAAWTEPNGLIGWTAAPPSTTTATNINGASAAALSGTVSTGLHWGIVCFLLSDTVIAGGVITEVGTISPASPPFPVYVSQTDGQITVTGIPTGSESVVGRLLAFTVAGGAATGNFFYIGADDDVGGVTMNATLIPDNVTTTWTGNFGDTYLADSVDITDALTRVIPNDAAGIMYSPSTRRIMAWGDAAHPSVIQTSESDDPGNFQGDTGIILVSENDGTALTCVFESPRAGLIFAGKTNSLFRVEPNNNVQSTWRTVKVSNRVGICGPMAVDVFESMAVIVHDTGAYIIDMTASPPAPVLISDELCGPNPANPGIWQRINWKYREKIWVSVDEIGKEVRIGVPLDNSVECSHILKCNFRQGWEQGYAYSPFSLKWHWKAGRKWSYDTIAASNCLRVQRPYGPGALPSTSVNKEVAISQILLGSAGADGTVSMISPDAQDDNGAAIYPCKYVSGSTNSMEARTQARVGVDVCGLVQINAHGRGQVMVSVVNQSGVATRAYGVQLNANVRSDRSIPCRATGERLSLSFSSPLGPITWWAVGLAAMYSRPFQLGWPQPVKAT